MPSIRSDVFSKKSIRLWGKGKFQKRGQVLIPGLWSSAAKIKTWIPEATPFFLTNFLV